jgi:hypothetical protein
VLLVICTSFRLKSHCPCLKKKKKEHKLLVRTTRTKMASLLLSGQYIGSICYSFFYLFYLLFLKEKVVAYFYLIILQLVRINNILKLR